MRDATFKVLSAEAQLVLRFLNAEIRWSVVDSKDAAKRRKDIPEVVRCKERIDQFDKEVTKSSLLRTMNGIARARGELRKIVVEELLELAMLQAALKWAAWKVGDRAPVTAWIDVLERCAEVDQMFHKARRFGLEDLDMVVGVVSTTLGSMRTIHDSTLTRAIKIAGKDLAKMDEAAQIRIVDQRKREPVTALMMSDTLTGVKEAQLAAREMLKHLFLMEASLGELLKGVESRHRAYDECAALLPPEDEVVEREVFGRFEV
ncbi:hypothetical protein T440DRAFT_472255 [Plenodomus tracheiphilus IPT5]|uniref:Uncharacterized protein n=1 Tax=Plenodomus tracheiphilus IPT5 TaxID=1408161 RepID=A0A6A7ARK6_9PLEO|nr:hypothetical protein T440DRAFT_472255 [Plenodomus tracheiphilus IPT5]